MRMVIYANNGKAFPVVTFDWDEINYAIDACKDYEDELLWNRLMSIDGVRMFDGKGCLVTDIADFVSAEDVNISSEEALDIFNELNERYDCTALPAVGHYLWDEEWRLIE